MHASKRKTYGQMDCCGRCGQDIQWMGKAHGWRDRGNNRGCVAYHHAGEIVNPPITAKHSPEAKHALK